MALPRRHRISLQVPRHSGADPSPYPVSRSSRFAALTSPAVHPPGTPCSGSSAARPRSIERRPIEPYVRDGMVHMPVLVQVGFLFNLDEALDARRGVAEGKGDLPKMIGPDGDGGAAIVERHAGRELFAAIAWRRDLLHAPVQGEELRAGVPPGAGGIMLRPIAARCWFFGWFTTGRAPGVRCRGGSTFPRRKRHRPPRTPCRPPRRLRGRPR